MKPIFLVGYMGCGKSTLGRKLARRLGASFVDTDAADLNHVVLYCVASDQALIAGKVCLYPRDKLTR